MAIEKLNKTYVNNETKLNAEDFQENVDKIDELVDFSNSVIESGTNSNGNYLKFSDETKICYFAKGLQAGTCSKENGMYRYDFEDAFTFPVSFNASPSIIISNGSSSALAGALVWFFQRDQNGINLIRLLSPNDFSNQYVSLNYIAIGK